MTIEQELSKEKCAEWKPGVEGDKDKDKEYTEEQQEKAFDLLSKKLKAEKGIIVDRDLVGLTRQAAQEAGVKGNIFNSPKKRPLIFYRALKSTEAVEKLLKKDEDTQRPFSYSLPGTEGDLPLSYGGENPTLIRIIDTSGKWEDTAPYWGFGPKGTWREAMNLDKVVLRKINQRSIKANDAYRQVGAEVDVGKKEITQITFIVDKFKTEKTKENKDLEIFAGDIGFWREVAERAKHFGPQKSEYGKKLNGKYLEYFEQTIRLSENKTETEEAKAMIKMAKIEICKLIKKATDAKKDDSNWTPELCKKVLGSFSEEAWQSYFDILTPLRLGENPTKEGKERLFEERAGKIKEKTGDRLNREDYKL